MPCNANLAQNFQHGTRLAILSGHDCTLQAAMERVHLLPAALRALSAALLADHKVGRGQQQQPQHSATHHLCAKLLAHPRAPIFLDAVFDAVRTLYRMVGEHYLPGGVFSHHHCYNYSSPQPQHPPAVRAQCASRALLSAADTACGCTSCAPSCQRFAP